MVAQELRIQLLGALGVDHHLGGNLLRHGLVILGCRRVLGGHLLLRAVDFVVAVDRKLHVDALAFGAHHVSEAGHHRDLAGSDHADAPQEQDQDDDREHRSGGDPARAQLLAGDLIAPSVFVCSLFNE